jgi:hypothetical protein
MIWLFGILYEYLVYYMIIWYILLFGNIWMVLVNYTKKYLATLGPTHLYPPEKMFS